MINKFYTLSTILLSSLIIAGTTISAQGITTSKLANYKIGSPISIPELKLSKNTYVSDYKYVDITGDNIKDNVILTGTKTNKADIYFENLNIIVQNGKTKKFIKSSLGKDSAGYQPTIFLGDFNGDKKPDIFIKMPTGGSGGFTDYSIIKLKGNNLSVLWDSKKNDGEIDLIGKFEDNFMVSLSSKKLNKTFEIDLSANKVQYIDSNIYDKDGKLKENIEPWMGGLGELTPIDTDKNGTYELIASQRIVGTCNADTLGYLQSRWKWDGKNIKLDVDKVSIKHIFTQTEADVNGDGIKEFISLTGTSDLSLSGLYVENISIDVYDSKTNKVKQVPVSKNNSGYTPTLFVADLNNDKAEELLISIPSGGSGGMKSYSLISLKDNKVINLFDTEKFSYGLEYDVQFKDGFKVDVNVKDSNKTYSLDISSTKDAYINLNVYNSDGKLMENASGMRNPLSNVEVKAVDGKYQLISSQRVIGTSNAETLGYVQGTWDIQQDGIKLVNVEVVNP
ncbi:hypothetical protein G9F72_013015 [Clostridium estertheticum]|uniref:hypothetical protein n=1 Tax=Clostridium estertheticum TaxID=238834 RepID=UPI0013E98D8A|nr:hypothetical protein [Clostridium estertheticum]MBZ9687247.1 hypothetical protein [Clostridium estertheticum]